MDSFHTDTVSESANTTEHAQSVTVIPNIRRRRGRPQSTAENRRRRTVARVQVHRDQMSGAEHEYVADRDAVAHRLRYANEPEEFRHHLSQEHYVQQQHRRSQERPRLSDRRTGAQDLLESVVPPLPSQLKSHEQEPHIAFMLLHQTSGSQHSLQSMTTQVDDDDVPIDLKEAVGALEPLSDQDKSRLMEAYQAQLNKL